MHWSFTSEPESRKTYQIDGGKMIGGSSCANAAAYERSTKQTWDTWARVVNDKRWEYNQTLEYFKLSETNDIQNEYHGNNGPVNVISCPMEKDFETIWRNAAVEEGYPYSDDLSGEQQTGLSFEQMTFKNGRRVSSASAYLDQIMHERKNLTILTQQLVEKILFDGKKAVGVIFTQGQTTRKAYARKEIILSAGAIMSPVILQQSGVGDSNKLQTLGITPIHDLPGVGMNLLDNGIIVLNYKNAKMPWLRGDMCQKRPAGLLDIFKLGYPQILFSIKNDQRADNIFVILFNSDVGSRGTVELHSSESMEPKITVGLLSPLLENTMLNGIVAIQNLMKSDALVEAYGEFEQVKPGPKDDLREFIKDHMMPSLHYAGTCKMGTKQDRFAVVDSEFRVLGIENLRVIDASVIPILLESGTYAATVMLGERGAAFIKQK